MFLKLTVTLFAVLPAWVYSQPVLSRDSVETQTMRSAIFIHAHRGGYSIYLDGRVASDSVLKAHFSNYPEAALAYGRFTKMMSHEESALNISLIGMAAGIVLLPTFAIPAVSRSSFCQGAETVIFCGSFCFGVGWILVSRCKIGHAVRLYNRSLFIQAGLPARRIHHRIKSYYYKVFGIPSLPGGGSGMRRH